MFCIRRFGLFALVLLLMLTTTAVPASRAALLEAQPQGPAGTAFTYQGQLNSAGTPVNASCDFQFSLWDDVAAGAQVGATLAPTLNVVDGLFTATLDFGDQFNGDARWLEIALQCPGDPDVTVLSPRAALLGVPYAHGLRPGIGVTDSVNGSSASIAVPEYGLAGSSTNGSGVYGETATSYQVGVKGVNSAVSGIGVRGEAHATGGVGVWGQSNANTGVYGLSTSGAGVWGQSTSGPAIRAEAVNGHGVWVASSGWDGVFVHSAGWDGVNVDQANLNGVDVGTVNVDGLYVGYAGTDGVDVAGMAYAGNFRGHIIVSGNCFGCLQANFAVNVGELALAPGDVVSIQSVTSTDFDSGADLWQVVQAQSSQGLALANARAVVGVVAGRAELVTEKKYRSTETGRRLVPRDGVAQPGDYVTIVYSGPMQVKVAPGVSAVVAGTRLTAAVDGTVRPLQTRTIDSMIVAEGAPILGEALEPAKDGLVWVLVNPQ